MGFTLYTIEGESTATPDVADSIPFHDASAVATKRATGSSILAMTGQLTALTSGSTGTAILPYGKTSLTSADELNYMLTPPQAAGHDVIITQLTTALNTVTSSGAKITTGTSGTLISFFRKYGVVRLTSVTTDHWMVLTSSSTDHFTLTDP